MKTICKVKLSVNKEIPKSNLSKSSNLFFSPYTYEGIHKISLPKSSKILSAQYTYDGLHIWALSNVNNAKETINLYIVGNNGSMGDDFNGEYISTFQIPGNSEDYHIFIIN